MRLNGMLRQSALFQIPTLLIGLAFMAVFSALNAAAPPPIDYGNAWVDLNKPWIKLRVWEDGVYRVSAADLAAGGLDSNSVTPANLHLFFRGQEQYIHVATTVSGKLDYIDFYGKRNDGREDSTMYKDPNTGVHSDDQIPNIRISIFSDTAAYFLTWDNTPGLRVTPYSDNSYSSYTPEPNYRFESFYEFHPSTGVAYNKGGGGQYDYNHILNSYYITGEGYVGRPYQYGSPRTIFVPTPQAYNNGTVATISYRSYGFSRFKHFHDVKVVNTVSHSDSVLYIGIKSFSFPYSTNLAASTRLQFIALGSDPSMPDFNYLCWAAIEYDRKCHLAGLGLTWAEKYNRSSPSYLRFSNTNIVSQGWIWDLTNHVRAEGIAGGDSLKTIIPATNGPARLCVVTDASLKTATVEPVTFGGLSATTNVGDFLIITHRSLAASADAYKQYRDTCTVNPLQAKVVYVEDIYNEFGYGTITPLAIKRFCKFAIENWATPPKYVLLWGKGQYETRNHPNNLVPTWGYPACDYEFVSEFDPMVPNIVPVIGIGRVNAFTDADGMAYLEKVRQYEHTPWQSWMKKGVFLGGGNDLGEQGAILQYLRKYKQELESAPYTGIGDYWQKYNTGILTDTNQYSGPTQSIDEGAGLVHFFGHSSSNVYDVDIQEPYLYENYGKFPFMVAFGCYGGDFTGGSTSFGERFITEENRGAIGYFANSTAGFLGMLGQFGDYFYPNLYDTHLGEPIGDVIRYSIGQYYAFSTDQAHKNHGKQMNLQGDPAIALYHSTKPDLSIVEDDVWMGPDNYSSSDSVFMLNMVIRNLAIAAQDSFRLSVRQLTPQGNWIIHADTLLQPVLLADTVQIIVPNTLGELIAGQNTFDIFVDSTNIISEISESNNRLSWVTVIGGNVPGILYPYDFAVVDSNRVTLAASALVMSGQTNIRYIYEIDTDINFNTPNLLSSGVVLGSAVYSEWEVPFQLKDSTVYYWRVRFADEIPAIWAQASFKYIIGKRGWAQSHPPQFFKDVTDGVEMSQLDREWQFEARNVNLHAWVRDGGNAYFRLDEGAFRNIDVSGSLWGIMFNTIDAQTLLPGSVGTVNGDWRYVAMPTAQNDLIGAIGAAPAGQYFLICSQQNAQPQLWSSQSMIALHSIGVDTSRFRALGDYESFLILGRKGFVGQAVQLYEPNIVDTANNVNLLDIRQVLSSSENKGHITSTRIGPSVEWKELIWDWNTLDQFNQEVTAVSLRAIRLDNSDSLIYQGLPKGSYPLNGVDPIRFPYMRLSALVSDSLYYTAPQLRHWHILNEATPDAAIDPVTRFVFDQDTVYEGQSIHLGMGVRNVSDTDMDSILVGYRIIRPNMTSATLPPKRYAVLPAQQRIDIDYTFSTGGLNLNGDEVLEIHVNPNFDQPELHLWNNVYTYPFYVIPDDVNPLLDVTFDGKHLLEGDIISPTPEIHIQINDDNEYMAVSDTAFEVYFGPRSLTGSGLQRVFINGNPNMEQIPAVLPENKAQIYFRPDRLADGEYTLRVQGFDQNRNASGPIHYEINFEVVNKAAVTEVLNYPNPFSTSTRFVYTLTGEVLPEQFEIQIFTITGKLVKVIDLAEMGDVHYGRNVSDYAWDGRDEFGDLLANGVYIYKVITKLNGETMELRDEGISEYFNKGGFGKMYIMR